MANIKIHVFHTGEVRLAPDLPFGGDNSNAIKASGGLGLEFAKILARKKYDLVLVARNEGKLYALKANLETEYGISVYPFAADLSVVDAALDVFNYTLEHEIRIDMLINNAGFGDSGSFA